MSADEEPSAGRDAAVPVAEDEARVALERGLPTEAPATTIKSVDRPRCLVEAGFGIGDVVEATPACHALWLLGFDVDLFVNRPDAPGIAAMLRGHPAFHRVLTDAQGIDPAAYAFGVACQGPSEVVRRLPTGHWFSTSYGDVAREGLLEANLAAARGLGYDAAPPPHPFALAPEPSGLDPGTVVVHAGSDPVSPFKRWPHWEALCDRVRALGHPVVVVGTEDDRSPSGWERRFDARFDLPFERLAVLLRDAHAYLGNDSGVGHLAGAVGTPGLLLFGPTDPHAYAPRSPALRILAAPGRPGEGWHPFTTRFPSIDRLGFETVLAEATRVLSDPPRPEPTPTIPRRGPPQGDRRARLPTRAEVAAAPPTFDGMELLFRRTTAATVLGSLARRDDPAALAAWRREAARAMGLVHLRAAALRRARPTPFGVRRSRSHLRHAWRAGWRLRSLAQRLVLECTPRRPVAPDAGPVER